MQKVSQLYNSYLYKTFYKFYSELEILKQSAISGNWAYDDSSEIKQTLSTFSPNALFQRILTLIELQELDAAKYGGEFGVVLFQEIKFIMAVCSDEIFLILDWKGQSNWKNELLESKLFDTNSGGEVFFKKIEDILNVQDPVYIDLALIYLNVLSLGFRGKYYGLEDHGEIQEYKKKLFFFIFFKHPDLLKNQKHLLPSAYDCIIQEPSTLKVPGIRRWIWYCAGVTGILFISSYIMWKVTTEELVEMINQILL